MRAPLLLAVLGLVVCLSNAYSKYGRTCKDIGCQSNEMCVMKEDPCSRFQRDQCGSYPSCKRVTNAASTCATYVCPPTQVCRMDGGQPKCFDSDAPKKHKRHIQSGSPDDTSPSAPSGSTYSYVPSYANYPTYPQNTSAANIYPSIPSVGAAQGQSYPNANPADQNTDRPRVHQPAQQPAAGGYQGGNVGSAYPGGQGGYPRQSGYPSYPGYPSQSGGYPNYPQSSGYPGQGGGYPGRGSGYPAPGYPNYPQPGGGGSGGGYPSQWGGYPNQGYQQPGGYPYRQGGYQPQGGNYPNYNQGYNPNYNYNQPPTNPENNIWDKITAIGKVALETAVRSSG